MASCLPASTPPVCAGMRHALRRGSTPLAPSPRHRVHTGVLHAVDHLKPHDHGTSPFAELGIQEIWDGIGKTRVRQHVNPLRSGYQVPTGPLDWHSMFADPTRPLVVDIGCGPGRFLLLMHHRHSRQLEQQQQQQQEASSSGSNSEQGQSEGPLGTRSSVSRPMNYLGLEIRQPYVERARTWAERLGCSKDVQFVFTNATISMATMLSSYPGPVQLVCLQFPDPHFKRRNHKRRIFQPNLVKDVANVLERGGCVFLQSDVEPVSVAMRNVFEHEGSEFFQLAPEHSDPDAVFFGSPSHSGLTPEHEQANEKEQANENGQAGVGGVSGNGSSAAVSGNGTSATAVAAAAAAECAPQSSSRSGGVTVGQQGSGQSASSSSNNQGVAGGVGEAGYNQQGVQEGLQGSSSNEEGASSSDEEGGEYGVHSQQETQQQQQQQQHEREGSPVVRRRRGRDEVDWERVESRWAAWGWLRHNPVGVPTEREHYCMQQQLRVYRVLLERK